MDFSQLWNQAIVEPLEWVLRTLAELPGVGGGLAIILMTIIIKSVLLPLSLQQTRSMKAMQALQPEIAELKKKYKDRERVTQETMNLYKERGVNPAAGCLPMIPTMVVLFGLYGALQNISHSVDGVCSLPCDPAFQEPFLHLQHLNEPDILLHLGTLPIPGILPLLMAVTQFFSSKMMTMPSTDPQQQMMNRMTTVMMPGMMLFWGVSFPAGLVLYWLVSNLFEMGRLYFTMGPGSLGFGPGGVRGWLTGSGDAAAGPRREADGALPPGRGDDGETPGSGARADGRPARSRQKRGKRSGRR